MAKRRATKPRVNGGKKGHRFYTEAERYAAMLAIDANGGDCFLTSAQLGIPEPTLRAWKSGFRSATALQLYTQKRGDMAAAIESVVWQLIDVAADKIEAAPLNHVMTGIGIGVDKMRLLRGESTNISDNTNRNTNVNLDRLVEMLTDDQRRQLIEIFEGHDAGGDGRSEARLPETSGVPLLERELPSGREVVPDQ